MAASTCTADKARHHTGIDKRLNQVTSESDSDLVTPRNGSVSMIELRNKDRPIINSANIKINRSLYQSSLEKIQMEEIRTLIPNGIHYNQSPNSLPPRLEKITQYEARGFKVRSNSPPQRHFSHDCGRISPLEMRRYSVSAYEDMMKSSYPSRYESQASHRLYENYAHYQRSSEYIGHSESMSDAKSRSSVGPRLKFTPLREGIPHQSLSEYPFQSHLYEKKRAISPPSKHRYNIEDYRQSYSQMCHLSCCSSRYYGEKHPYYESPYRSHERKHSPILRSKEPASGYEREEYLAQRFDESGDIRASAFSVIRSPIHRMSSNESGYSSEPSNFIKSLRSHEESEIGKHRLHSHTELAASSFPVYRDIEKCEKRLLEEHVYRNKDECIEKNSVGNKLHVYDVASKAALKAFDAHVEKMMTGSREQQKHSDDQTDQSTNKNELKNNNDVLPRVTNKESHFITSSPPSVVQCSTVDSTQTSSDGTFGINGLLGLTMVANEHLGQAIAKEKKRSKNNNCLHLWQFLRSMLNQEKDKPNKCIEWTNRDRGEFRLIKTAVIADLWGQSKNRTCMTYEKMARAMRYYYKMKILEKVPHKRLHFRFGEKMLAKVLDVTTIKPLTRVRKVDEHCEIKSEKNYGDRLCESKHLDDSGIIKSPGIIRSPGVISSSGILSSPTIISSPAIISSPGIIPFSPRMKQYSKSSIGDLQVNDMQRKTTEFTNQIHKTTPDYSGEINRKSPDYSGEINRNSPDYNNEINRKSPDYNNEIGIESLDYNMEMHRKTPKYSTQTTPVICSTNNVFLPEKKVFLQNNGADTNNSAESDNRINNDSNLVSQKSFDSDTNMTSYSEDTPFSSTISDSDGELIVDTGENDNYHKYL